MHQRDTDDLPPAATQSTHAGERSDVGPHSANVTGRAPTLHPQAARLPASDDQHCRAHYEREGNRLGDRSYDDVRACYAFGHAAALNPARNDRAFEEIEADLQKEWTEDNVSAHGDWAAARAYAREGFARGITGRGGA